MQKRMVLAALVLVLVLGGGLLALQRTGSDPPAAPAAATESVPQPAAPAVAPPPPAVASRPSAVLDADPDGGTIDGRVINGVSHEGVPDAELTFVGDDGVSTFRTSRDGSFVLAPAVTGSFVLAAITAPGFLPYAHQVGVSAARLALAHGHPVHGVTLLLYPAVGYDGIVVDARGAPVADVRVRVLAPPGEQVMENPPEWKTGRDGHFTFQADDHAVLEASRGVLRGWAEIDRSVRIMKQLTIHLGYPPPHNATISGRVRDVRGAPLADAVVRAAPSAYLSTAPAVVATTGSDGRFTLAGVDRAAYDVSADAADHLRGVRTNIAGGSRDIELVLDAGLPLAGQVVDRRGEPVPSFTLIVQRRAGLARAPVETVSVIDPQGRFGVRVATGDYDLIATAPDQPRTAVPAVAGATDVRIVVGSGVTLRGTVISSDDRTPIADAFVGPETADGGPNTPTALPVTSTRADGTFELTGIAAGPLAIRAFGRGYAPKIEELPEASDGAAIGPITIELARRDPPPARDRDISGIGVNVIPEGHALRVVAVLPNSGAVDAGLDAGDLIVSVDDLPVATLGVDGSIARLRGPPGTSVTLTVRRDGHDSRRSVARRKLQG
ncbi:MAG TPA: carboxypeptidase regulatory-like domain-containing protein [Kofleriaceae bacterium]